uniref:ATP-dependent DNA helicase n=1 Tax=Octopus bimaculoides TaxID=37653 RepID=A0A0L8GQ09_OCTBM
MLSNNALHAIDTLLKEIMHSNRLFDGKVFLLDGYFCQTAPVILRDSNAAISETVSKLSLTENVHTEEQEDFSRWLLKIGNGTLYNDCGLTENTIEILEYMLSSEDIVRDIFGESLDIANEDHMEDLASKIIFTPTNKDALKINESILTLLPGQSKEYFSVVTISLEDAVSVVNVPVEFLNSLTPRQFSGIPAFAMTINKSQEQSFCQVGIYLPFLVFSHEQLYVS